jgi:hypothetical protein
MIHIVRDRATKQQVGEMCEFVLLEDGSQQEFIWGADWNPATQEVTFEALINIRPRQTNRSLELQDPTPRAQVEKITRNLLGGV